MLVLHARTSRKLSDDRACFVPAFAEWTGLLFAQTLFPHREARCQLEQSISFLGADCQGATNDLRISFLSAAIKHGRRPLPASHHCLRHFRELAGWTRKN